MQALNDRAPVDGRFVLYWMQRAQRVRLNHALDYAIRLGNARSLPVVAVFGLYEHYPEAGARHFAFMLEGLREAGQALARRRIALAVRRAPPDEAALWAARHAAAVVVDRGYLRHEREWRARVADEARCAVTEVESDVVVPVEIASDRAEVAARTLRPKIMRALDDWLHPLRPILPLQPARSTLLSGDVALDDPAGLLAGLDVDRSVRPTIRFHGGAGEARRRLSRFIRDRLTGYAEGRGDPAAAQVSTLSPYLHFGQISPVEVALAIRRSTLGDPADRAAFIEELVVRRELAINFVRYTPDYDAFTALPEWARATLARHASDPRPAIYPELRLERGETEDRYWNAAMREMRATGYLHNHMRMYWGKRILEWSASPEAAFRTALRLNNRWLLDGRDAASYANVAWCFGLHDRPWPERAVFGTVRSMTAGGLERKLDIDRYVAWTDTLEDPARY